MNCALESSISRFGRANGELLIGDSPVSKIAEEYGTPLYIYSREIMRRRHDALRRALPDDIQVYYAVKANPNTDIIALMGDYYDGFDISSLGEMDKAVRAGISPEKMSFAGPGKRIDELARAIGSNIGSISVESEQEFDHILSLCSALDTGARVMIRVNPDFELTQSGMAMSGPRQFGIDSERVPALIERIRRADRIDFQGIHIFSGSQNLSAGLLAEHFAKIIRYALETGRTSQIPMKIINIGGGFGIPYFAHEKDLDLSAAGSGLKDILIENRAALDKTIVRIELGRFLVGECGIYLCRVLYRKESRGRVFLILDGGMHHHLAASGNLGQSLARRPMPVVTANGLDRPLEKVTVAGPLCTPLDTFGTVDLPHAGPGDLVAVMNSGAYGLTASPLDFLSHTRPREIIV